MTDILYKHKYSASKTTDTLSLETKAKIPTPKLDVKYEPVASSLSGGQTIDSAIEMNAVINTQLHCWSQGLCSG